MDGYESLDVEKQLARYRAGFSGGVFNKTPYTPPAITIVNGVPDTYNQVTQSTPSPDMTISDPWYGRVTAKK